MAAAFDVAAIGSGSAPVIALPRPGLPADFNIEAYLHATLAKRIMMIDGAMGSAFTVGPPWRSAAAASAAAAAPALRRPRASGS